MCYTHGPRCSKHAKVSLRAALASRDNERIAEAKREYLTTKEGIAKLRSQGKEELAEKLAARRAKLIERSKRLTKEAKEQEKTPLTFSNVLKSRKSKVVVVGATGFLAATLLTGCSASDDADYAAACKDAKSNQRVSDDKCSDDGIHSGVYGWYFYGMNKNSGSNNNGTRVPAIGAPMTSGGVTDIPDGKNYKYGVNPSGDTVTREGFGKGGSYVKESGTKVGGFGSSKSVSAGKVGGSGGGGKVSGG